MKLTRMILTTLLAGALTLVATTAPAQDTDPPPAELTLLERAHAVAQPTNWPMADRRDNTTIQSALTTDEAITIADELIAKQSGGLLAQEAAWLAWHLVAMDEDAWVADGVITHRADEITSPQVRHLIYETPEGEWLADRMGVGYSVATLIQRRRDPDSNDDLIELYLGSGNRSKTWQRDVTSYAAGLTLDEQIALWDNELAGLLALANPPQEWMTNISNRLVALTIRKKTQL